MWLTEQMRYDPESGRLLTHDTWEYKVPSSKDIPQDFRVSFNDSKRNTQSGFLGSKAVGEQSFLMGCSAIFALRHAINSVKNDQGENPMPFYTLGLYFHVTFVTVILNNIYKRKKTFIHFCNFRWTSYSRNASIDNWNYSRKFHFVIL